MNGTAAPAAGGAGTNARPIAATSAAMPSPVTALVNTSQRWSVECRAGDDGKSILFSTRSTGVSGGNWSATSRVGNRQPAPPNRRRPAQWSPARRPADSSSSRVSRRPGRVGQLDRPAVDGGGRGDDVAGRARQIADDRPLKTDQGIHEAALADVGPAGQHDPPRRREMQANSAVREDGVDRSQSGLANRRPQRQPASRESPRRAHRETDPTSTAAVRAVGASASATWAAARIGSAAVSPSQSCQAIGWQPRST